MTIKTHSLGFGVSLGAGVTIEDKPKLTYLSGISMYFGQQKQLNVTAGIASVRVNKLRTALYENEP